ncbi:TetR/AcrR family transcriptional regulator [Streptacidiphilus fuscans]|uniref:TetR family transcriptional regulator n=1 Tax=Streptacidiphilus fuscans TaxID=2789292 RepID=A0A931FIB1_9ACTN|nr:TetR/AcrR family transcriptional regulator [Streptacidiphilus fuscans]MBF9072726.1 TetR family transcriptional regulator [Streptacidiphilus fuscans]
MARWEPDAQGRLQQAAMELFAERGYAEVTVAEIADRAGLTKRTFFNHFADKREVLFAGAKDLEQNVVAHLAEADGGLTPIEAAVHALAAAGEELAGYGEYARARQQLIASSTELQERDLIKTAALTSAIADALRLRNVPAGSAVLAAQAATSVFTAAYSDWITDTAADLHTLMRRSLDDLRVALGSSADSDGPG